MLDRLSRPRLPRLQGSTLLLGALAAAGTALVLLRGANQGVGLHTDSVLFMSVAKNLLAGQGFSQLAGVLHGGQMVHWPPLYPMLLAAAGWVAGDPLAAAGPTNAAIFGMTALISGWWLRKRLRCHLLALWGCLAVVLSIPLARDASWALSEPLFILLTTLALINIEGFLQEGRRSSWLWAAFYAALACLTKYLGVALVAAGTLLLLFQHGASWPAKLKRTAGFVLIALVPLALWLLRNLSISGQFTGPRNGIHYSLPDILQGMAHSLLVWMHLDLFQRSLPPAAAAVLVGALWLALAFAVAYCMVKAPRAWRSLCVFGVFALTYLAALASAMAAGTTWGGFQPRFLSPAYLPMLFVAVVTADKLLGWAGRSGPSATFDRPPSIRLAGQMLPGGSVGALRVALVAALCLWTLYSGLMQGRETARAYADGIRGSIAEQRAGSEVMRHVQGLVATGLMFSNDIYALYLVAESATLRHLEQGADYPRRLAEALREPTHIVWFRDWQMNEVFGYNDFDLRFLPGVETLADFADGVVLRLTPGERFDERRYRAGKQRYFNQAILEAGPLLKRSHFDLHLRGETLAYFKSPCTAKDTKAGFFLHVLPAYRDDLPVHSRRHGFENLDFQFHKRGLRLGGRCLVRRQLPDYPIAGIRTGQFIRGQGRLWSAEIIPGEPT